MTLECEMKNCSCIVMSYSSFLMLYIGNNIPLKCKIALISSYFDEIILFFRVIVLSLWQNLCYEGNIYMATGIMA